ncbi:phage tail tape measure protein [Pseudomonas sp. BN415]|nr:phage tail tape measure protein [Pseudomonas sp. BN415]
MEAHKVTQQALGAEVNVHRRAVSNLQRALLSAKEPSAALNQQYLMARDRLTQLETGYRQSQSQMRRYKDDIAKTTAAVQTLNGRHQDQSQRLANLRTRLESAGISTDNLATHEQQLAAGMVKANAAIQAQQAKLAELTRKQEALNRVRAQYDRTQQLAGSMAGAGAASAATGAAMGAPVIGSLKSYIDFEDAMLGVAKQVEGARDDNGKLTATYYEMGDAIKAMSERIPMATTEIAALVEGGARMGIQGKDNLLKFAEVAANAATAFELPADQIGENLARIANLYKLPIKNISQLGDAINYLDDNAQSKGADIIDVMQRTAGVTASVGMSFRDAAALGSTFLSLGASAEVAGTATKAMIRELSIAADQPKRFQNGLKTLGLDAAALQSDMVKDATGTIQKVLEAVNRLPQDQQLSVTTQLFGKDYGDDAAKLANNIQEYRRQLELANAAGGNGSMQREADIRADAMSARLEMAQNRLFNLSSGLGETLRPTLVELLEGFGAIVGRISAWVKANPELTGQILKTVAGVAALATGFGAVALAMAGFLGPFAMFRYGLALTTIRGVSLGGVLLNIGRKALPLVATGLRLLGALALANPILAVITGIALGATLIYANWDKLGPYFEGMWAEIKAGFNGGLGGIITTLMNFNPVGLVYRAFAEVLNYLGLDLPVRFTEFGNMIVRGLVNGLLAGLSQIKGAINQVASSTIGWFKEKLGIHSPSRVFAQLGGFTMQGLEQGLAGGEKGPLSQMADTAKRLAQAGAVSIGLTAASMATATPAISNVEPLNIDKRAPLGAARAAPASAPAFPPITVQVYAAPGMSEQQLAQLVGQKVGEALAQASRASQARARSSLSDQE